MPDLGESTEDSVLQLPSAPANVGATSNSFDVETDSVSYEALPVTDVDLSGAPDVPVRPPVEFDPRYRQSFEGLLYIGKIIRDFRWLGHSFRIQSPKTDDLLEAGQLHKPYADTVASVRAWQSLMIAACLVSIDGKPMPIPFEDGISPLEAKFDYINRHWYSWTIDHIYNEYMFLDADVQSAVEAMGKASGSMGSTPGSSNI
jgi:hypothetical protein